MRRVLVDPRQRGGMGSVFDPTGAGSKCGKRPTDGALRQHVHVRTFPPPCSDPHHHHAWPTTSTQRPPHLAAYACQCLGVRAYPRSGHGRGHRCCRRGSGQRTARQEAGTLCARPARRVPGQRCSCTEEQRRRRRGRLERPRRERRHEWEQCRQRQEPNTEGAEEWRRRRA